MERTEVNCQTGEIKVIQLTAEEIAALPIPVPPTYQQLRAAAYPPIVDQLDTIFHGGLDAWKAEIQAVKTQFPKEVA
jgi:hypothetical protein